MAKQEKSVHKKSMGRPPGIKYGGTIPARFEIPTMEALDAWAEKHDVTRSEAIRRLVELGLAGAKKFAAPSQQTRAKAKKFAAEQIDRMGNSTATAEEQASRKQRLLKGPEEFREARVDRPKAKGK